jgi:Family of unknown function (DUF6090)
MEDDITKHTKKIFQIAKGTQHSLFVKMKDISTEIIIIIIAVTISIALQNWNTERHNRQEEREFLQGFKNDLQGDIRNMESSKAFYEESVRGLTYFLKVTKIPSAINNDSINKYSDIFFSNTSLDPHIERYEALKSTGKFTIIQNKELSNKIIGLQEVIIQRIHILNEKYYSHQERLETIISQNIQITPDGMNISLLLHRSDIFLLLSIGRNLIINNIIPFHTEGIKLCKDIIAQIDEELD